MNDIGFHVEVMYPGHPMSLSDQLRVAQFVEGMDRFGDELALWVVFYIYCIRLEEIVRVSDTDFNWNSELAALAVRA